MAMLDSRDRDDGAGRVLAGRQTFWHARCDVNSNLPIVSLSKYVFGKSSLTEVNLLHLIPTFGLLTKLAHSETMA
jgi:hypothetical protein